MLKLVGVRPGEVNENGVFGFDASSGAVSFLMTILPLHSSVTGLMFGGQAASFELMKVHVTVSPGPTSMSALPPPVWSLRLVTLLSVRFSAQITEVRRYV